MSMIPIFAWINVDSMGNGDDSNSLHISSYIFCTEKPANVEKSSTDTTETETQQPSTGEITSPPPSSSEATSAAHETTSAGSAQSESSSSASGSASVLSQQSFQTYEDTVHMLEATHFPGYNFYTEQDVETLIKQIPDISPYIDPVPEDEEPISKSRSLTKKELAKLTPEAKILNIASNKKAKEIKEYLLEKFDRVMVDTLDKDNNNCLFQSILCQISNHRFMFNSEGKQYDSQCLRLQTIAFMAINYEEMYNRVKHSLNCPYKRWLLDMTDPMTDGDTVALIGMRHLLKVSVTFHFFNSISFAENRIKTGNFWKFQPQAPDVCRF